MSSPKLTVELVPEPCWFSNVRSEVSRSDWDKIKQFTFQAAQRRCEICGGRGPKWPVECHEVWQYTEFPETHHIRAHGVQRLIQFVALCPACHEVKHLGLAELRERLDQALMHLAMVNQWSAQQAQQYRTQALAIWARRSQLPWLLDLSYLDRLNIQVLREHGRAA